MKRPPTPKLAARRREVSNLALKGWTQAAIARHLQIPQGTVSRDLAAMRESWREFPVYDFDKVRLEQLQKIDLVEAEAWAAWQRSQQQRHSAALTRGKSGEQTRTSLQDQYGDPRYLREIARCVAQRHQMIGVQPPEATRWTSIPARSTAQASNRAAHRPRSAEWSVRVARPCRPIDPATAATSGGHVSPG